MYNWVNVQGQTLKTETIKEFSDKVGMNHSNARSLACGDRKSLRGWISPHPSARKRKKRIFTKLINVATGEVTTLGKHVTTFARSRGLSLGRLSRLINKSRIRYENWMLLDVYQKAHEVVPGAEK